LRKKDLNFVSLDSKKFLTDEFFVALSPEERGVYTTLIFSLYANGGNIEMNTKTLSRLCNCKSVKHFNKIWNKIKHKFKKKRSKICHKKVTRELNRVKKLTQVRSEAGVKGNKIRWESYRKAIAKSEICDRKGSEGKRHEGKGREVISNRAVSPKSKDLLFNKKTLKGLDDFSVENNSSIKSGRVASSDIESRKLALYDILLHNLKALGSRNGVTFRNFVNWLGAQIQAGKFDNNTIWHEAAKLAEECVAPSVKNPPALFMKKVKSKLGYLKNEK